jgi:hypothetical protein
MRLVRYLLQLLIVVLACLSLGALALSDAFQPFPFLVLAGFFGFLFLLTQLLREQTESRIRLDRKTNQKFVGAFLTLVGLASCWMSLDVLNGYAGSSSRRGALLRWAVQTLGPVPPAVFFFLFGLLILRMAYG